MPYLKIWTIRRTQNRIIYYNFLWFVWELDYFFFFESVPKKCMLLLWLLCKESHSHDSSVKQKEKQMKQRVKDYFLSWACEVLKNSPKGQVDRMIYFHWKMHTRILSFCPHRTSKDICRTWISPWYCFTCEGYSYFIEDWTC